MTITLKILIPLLLVSYLTGCSTVQPVKQSPPETIKKTLPNKTLHTWHAIGAIAIWTPHGNTTAHWRWQQQNAHYTLQLAGPFNSGAIQITGQPGNVQLTTANGTIHTARSAEQLLLNETGWSLPVSFLYSWLRGSPVPHLPATITKNTHQQISLFTQNGWTIRYLDFTAINGFTLPVKIIIKKQGVNLRIVIRQWKIP